MSPEIRRRRRSRGFRRLLRQGRRFRQDHPRWTVTIGVGAVVLACLGWSLWVVLGASRDLKEVDRQARVMRAALIRGDAAGARAALEAYQEAADRADATTHGVTWSVFGAFPLLGDDADGVATVAAVLADLGREGLTPVADAADEVTAESFQPVDHTFPLEKIAALEEPAARSERAFDAASERLAKVDSSGFAGPIASAFDSLEELVDDARSTLQSTYRAARLMPVVLGQGEPRNYLLVLQNNAESRSSGGLPGSLSLIRAQGGEVRITDQVDMAELGATPEPVLPLTDEEEALFGRILGTVGVDATLTPDFPRAADLIRARWQEVRGQRVDGVLFVDPVVVSYLLRAIGEVPVPGYAPVTAANVVARVENEIYALTPGTTEQSDYQEAVAKAVFDVFSDGYGSSAEVIRALVAGVQEGRVRMHFFSDDAQGEIAGTRIAGEFVDRTSGPPVVGVYVNDAGPTKMQYYLRQRAQLYSRRCTDGRQELGTSITFSNATPPRADTLPDTITGEFYPGNRTDPGQQLLVVYVSAPVGGEVVSVSVDGQAAGSPTVTTYAGREVATIGVLLDPGQSQTVDVLLRSGKGQEDDPHLEMSPGATPGSSNATARSACRAR
ncbi:DUF4012 domain-containing protein [Nocardioides humi]|uniref:DUF4012 domain-containing protein n=1 Tax=Nocardioides humi TaxID=449461 RepID=A0ABN2AJ84_9ACTN|nr:DUF4012 domain-containing protein [Nocardioides humi]